MQKKFQKSTNNKTLERKKKRTKKKISFLLSYKNSALILLYLKRRKQNIREMFSWFQLYFTTNTQVYIYIYRFMHDYDPVRRREASWKWDTRKRKISERLFYDKENKEIVRDTDGFMLQVGERVLEINRLREKHFNLWPFSSFPPICSIANKTVNCILTDSFRYPT